MAGHSKWANTRHRKAAQDAKRGKIFTKIIRELVTAAKLGGGDPDANPRLRAAIDKALSNNMTRDTLNRAIARGVGGDDDGDAADGGERRHRTAADHQRPGTDHQDLRRRGGDGERGAVCRSAGIFSRF